MTTLNKVLKELSVHPDVSERSHSMLYTFFNFQQMAKYLDILDMTDEEILKYF